MNNYMQPTQQMPLQEAPQQKSNKGLQGLFAALGGGTGMVGGSLLGSAGFRALAKNPKALGWIAAHPVASTLGVAAAPVLGGMLGAGIGGSILE